MIRSATWEPEENGRKPSTTQPRPSRRPWEVGDMTLPELAQSQASRAEAVSQSDRCASVPTDWTTCRGRWW